MSVFGTTFNACAVPGLWAIHADSAAIVLQPPGDDPATTVDGIVGPEEIVRRRDDHGGLEVVRVRSVLIREEDLADEPTTNWTVMIGARTYAITHVQPAHAGVVEVSLEETRKRELTRDGVRRR